MHAEAIYEFKSHVAGKNADVSVYPDRIEWRQEASKLTLGRASKGSNMIPVKPITSVASAKSGLRTVVNVMTASDTIGFRVSHGEANQVKDLLTELVLGSHPSQQG